MDFPENPASGSQGILPQFFELASRSNQMVVSELTCTGNVQSQTGQVPFYTTAGHQRQLLINPTRCVSTRYTSPLLSWSDPNTLIQLCEKQGIQAINIPNYSQNNGIFGVQSNNLSSNIIPAICLPSASQIEAIKQNTDDATSDEQRSLDSQTQRQQSAAVAEYLQKLQATTLPLTLQQLIKLQTEQIVKKEKEEEKTEHSQNSILNIPSVSVFRNNLLQSDSAFTHSDHAMIAMINSNDLNVHLDSEQEDESNLQSIVKEQQIQTESPKIEKKSKFRAKCGVKVNVTSDGTTLYCCPECNLVCHNKTDIDQHIQAHIQERKYQCKECGAMLKRKEHLDQHMRGHSDERPFKCPICTKAFKRNEHLTRHYVIHSGDKNFSCNICQKAFSRKDHLNKHTQTHLGIRKHKTKKDSFFMDQKDSFDKSTDTSTVFKQEMNPIESSFLKPETFIQHIQNLQKDPNFLHTFTSLKEQAMREGNIAVQQSVNMNDILPQNTRYIAPS